MKVESRDIRVWVPTDRPSELLSAGGPLPGVWILSAKQSDRPWAEYHTAYTVCLVHANQPLTRASFSCRGRQCEATSGGLMTFEPGDHHFTTRVSVKSDFSAIGFSPDDIQRSGEELGARGAFHFKGPYLASGPLAQAVESFVDANARGADALELEWYRLELQRRLILGAGEATLCTPPDEVGHRGIRVVRDYLREMCRQNPLLDELAVMAGLSRFRLAHSFKRWLGLPPHAYLALVRASQARRSIERGTPIEQVASEFGYIDVPFLTRTLRRYFGVPPGRWRKMVRANALLASARSEHADQALG